MSAAGSICLSGPVDGSRLRHEAAHASGTIGNPMSDETIEAKFLANAAPVIGAEWGREIAACVRRLETLADVRRLVSLAVWKQRYWNAACDNLALTNPKHAFSAM